MVYVYGDMEMDEWCLGGLMVIGRVGTDTSVARRLRPVDDWGDRRWCVGVYCIAGARVDHEPSASSLLPHINEEILASLWHSSYEKE